MTSMDKEDFEQLINALDGIRNFLAGLRTASFSLNFTNVSPMNDETRRSWALLRRDAKVVAQMASQALERELLSVAQRIALKASLSQLEFEIRIPDA